MNANTPSGDPKIIGVDEQWSPGFSSQHHLTLIIEFPDCPSCQGVKEKDRAAWHRKGRNWGPSEVALPFRVPHVRTHEIPHECTFRTIPGAERVYRDKTYPLVVGSWGPFRVYQYASLTTESSPHWTAPPWAHAPVDGVVRPLWYGFGAGPKGAGETGSYIEIEYIAVKSGNLYHAYIEEKALQELLWDHQPNWVIRMNYGQPFLHKTNPKGCEVGRRTFETRPKDSPRWAGWVEWRADEGCRPETSWVVGDYKSEAEADIACDVLCLSKGFEPKRKQS